jgi:hypothetical protein
MQKFNKNLLVKYIISDFECALRNSIKLIFNESKIIGCFFHYCYGMGQKFFDFFLNLKLF